MIIGGVDEELIKDEQVAKIKIVSEDMYTVVMHGMNFGGQRISDYATALLDTGNTLISIPNAYKSRVFKAFSDAGIKCESYQEANADFYQIGCEIKDLDKIPELTVDLNGVIFKIKGIDLVDQCES